MNLYEIDAAITDLVDPETGELLNFEAFDALNLERDRKIENLGCWIKDLNAEAAAIKAEEDALKKRREALESKRDRLKDYVDRFLAGANFETARVVMKYRKSPARAEPGPLFVEWAAGRRDDLLRYKEPEVDKKALLAALKAGEDIEYAELVPGGMSLTIK